MAAKGNWHAQAMFSGGGGKVFRTQTLLYSAPTFNPSTSKHICAVVMFNPGSASPNGGQLNRLVCCNLDPTMHRITSWIEEAYGRAEKDIPAESHITIFNLYNHVSPNLQAALADVLSEGSKLSREPIDFKDLGQPLFVWQAWGVRSERVVVEKIAESEAKIRSSGLPVVGNGDRLLRSYHPSYLNRNNGGRKNLLIDQIERILSSRA